MYEKGTDVIFLVLPGERVVVLNRKKGDREPAIVLGADGTINFYEDGQYISTDLNEFSVADINPEVRRKMAETIDNVPVPKGFKVFAGRLQDTLRTEEAQPEQERSPSEHWPFANKLR